MVGFQWLRMLHESTYHSKGCIRSSRGNMYIHLYIPSDRSHLMSTNPCSSMVVLQRLHVRATLVIGRRCSLRATHMREYGFERCNAMQPTCAQQFDHDLRPVKFSDGTIFGLFSAGLWETAGASDNALLSVSAASASSTCSGT